MQGLLGDTVQGKDGTVEVSSFAKEGHVVGLYFSAHWCPPCRGFTPTLAQWYKDFKANSPNGPKLEMVFVSSDRDQKSFEDYYAEMPWLALPYDKRDEKNTLSKKFGVKGIPSLVFLEADTGAILTKNGRAIVSSDEKGERFPWKPKTLKQMLQGTVKAKEGDAIVEKDLAKAIEGKVLGIYFSAHWCPPCKSFTPELANCYNKLKEAGKNFEILFASSDKSEDQWSGYYGEMPWLALPHEDPRKDELDSHFEVQGIPTLVILNEECEVITTEGREAVGRDKEGAKFPWVPPPLLEITAAISGIQESHCLCYMTGAADSEKKAPAIANAVECLEEAAKEVQADTKAGKEPITICYETEEDDNVELAENLCKFINEKHDVPKLMYMNMDNGKKKVFEKESYTKEDIRQIVASIRDGSIQADCKGLKD